MIRKDDIIKILEMGIMAPSGENSQPWLFKIGESSVDVFNDPQKDTSLYNFQQRSNMVTHGCLLETLLIASEAMGYGVDLRMFPDPNNRDWIATLYFVEKPSPQGNSLYQYIAKRCTNRKPYKKTPLSKDHKKRLMECISDLQGVVLQLQQDAAAIGKLADVGAENEKIVFEHKELHHFLFQHLTWKKTEDEKAPGFFIETLELPPPIKLIFPLFKSWNVMRWLNTIGFSKLVKKGNQATYSAASAMGILMTDGKRDEDYILIGRALQRIWLTATELGLAVQPLTGILFFTQAIQHGASDRFSEGQITRIQDHYEMVRGAFDIGDRNAPVMFRIGYNGEPSARTSRFPVSTFIVTT